MLDSAVTLLVCVGAGVAVAVVIAAVVLRVEGKIRRRVNP